MGTPSARSLSRHTDHPSSCQLCSLTSHSPAALFILSHFCGHIKTHVPNGERSSHQHSERMSRAKRALAPVTALESFESRRAECRPCSPQASKVCTVSVWTLTPSFPAVLAVPFTGDWQRAKIKACSGEQQPALEQCQVCLQLASATPALTHRTPPTAHRHRNLSFVRNQSATASLQQGKAPGITGVNYFHTGLRSEILISSSQFA